MTVHGIKIIKIYILKRIKKVKKSHIINLICDFSFYIGYFYLSLLFNNKLYDKNN